MTPVAQTGDCIGGLYDESDDGGPSFRYPPGMRKMSKREMEKFPKIVAGSIRCQQYYISRGERCDGCNMAVAGCEKVCYMTAG